MGFVILWKERYHSRRSFLQRFNSLEQSTTLVAIKPDAEAPDVSRGELVCEDVELQCRAFRLLCERLLGV